MARGLKTQLELASSDGSRPSMRNVHPQRDVPWVWPPFTVSHGAFRKLKGFSRNKKASGTSQCIEKFLHISLLSFASSHFAGRRRRRSSQGFPRFTHWDKAACWQGALQREEGKQEDRISVVTFGSPASQLTQVHPAEGTSPWEQHYMR